MGQARLTLIFNTKSHLGLNSGVLISWIALSCCTIALFSFMIRRRKIAIATGQEVDRADLNINVPAPDLKANVIEGPAPGSEKAHVYMNMGVVERRSHDSHDSHDYRQHHHGSDDVLEITNHDIPDADEL